MTSQGDVASALISRFPRLFKGREPACGITTGAGWNALLTQLFDEIDHLLDDKQAALFHVRQVKQKFGGLRVYYGIGNSNEMVLDMLTPAGVTSIRKPPTVQGRFPRDAVDQCIARAAALALDTCEVCGSPGALRRDGWIRVLCDSCNVTGRSIAEGDERQ